MPARRNSDQVPRFQGLAPRSATTSRVGASNRPKNTNPEILLRKLLSSAGVRYRLHPPNVPGRPDLVIRRSRIVVFCDGDFWHGRHWARRKIKLSRGWNAAYWIAKIERNRRRDRLVTRRLKLLGWRVIRVWETEIQRNPKGVADNILDAIKRPPAA